MNSKDNTLYIWGALLGMGIGLLAAHLYRKALSENAVPEGQVAGLSAGKAIKLALLLVGLLRQIAELGAENTPKPESTS